MSLFLLPVNGLNRCSRCTIPPLISRRAASTTAAIPLRRIFPQNTTNDTLTAPASLLSRSYFNAFTPSRHSSAALGLGRSAFATFPSRHYFTRSFASSAASSSADSLSHGVPPSAHEQQLPPLPTLTHPTVAYYLIGIATLVFAIVVIGGLTRLTESGLSITEWNLVTGTLPPLNEEDWIEELRKYRLSPEGRLCACTILHMDNADLRSQDEQKHYHV